MKPFYGIDRTKDKKNSVRDDRCFIAASTSASVESAVDQAVDRAATQMGRAKLPVALRVIRAAAGWTAAIMGISILRSLGEVTFEDILERVPVVFWLMVIGAAVWLVLALMGYALRRSVESTEEYTAAVKRLETGVESAYRELGVPRDAKDVDIICIRHRWKNGKMKPAAHGLETSERTNESLKVYVRDGSLCLADTKHRYEIPLSELKCLHVVKKHLYSQGWNKPEDYDMGFYKPYKLTMDNYNRIHMKRYGILELEHAGESWGIWLPPYELNYISALTGMTITGE